MDEGSTLDHDSEILGEAPPTFPVGTQVLRRGFESMDLVKFDRDLEDQREFDEKCAEFFVGSALVGDVASVSWKLFHGCSSVVRAVEVRC